MRTASRPLPVLTALLAVAALALTAPLRAAEKAKAKTDTTKRFRIAEHLLHKHEGAGAENEFRALLAVRERELGPEHAATVECR